jgi:nitrous oxide reductase accessory protein NosL
MTQSNSRTNGGESATERSHGGATPVGVLSSDAAVTRRRVLVAGGVAGVATLAGCETGQTADGEPPDPLSLAGGKQCDVCGMVISEHPGPTGQIFYREHSPDQHDNPAWFDSLKACLFPYYFEHRRLDWTAAVVYVTDYSAVDYEVSDVEGQKYIEVATAAETFVDAEDAVFAVDSDVHGAMGPDFVPFSDGDDAEAFVREHGGRTLSFDEIAPETLS